MTPRVLTLTTVIAAMGLVGACGVAAPPAERPPAEVRVQGFLFSPSTTRVGVRERVRWLNEDEILHTATSGNPDARTDLFDGALDGRGRTFSFTFDAAGSYPYFCARHEHMRGTIVVSE